MEPLFAVRTSYNERMFYHQAAAGRPREAFVEKKKGPFSGVGMTEAVFFPVVFFVFFMTFRQLELSLRTAQSLIAALLVLTFLFFMNRRRDGGKLKDQSVQRRIEADRNQARILLENSELRDVRCTASFYDDYFRVENPGITTEYRYEGIAWIKETSDYYLIYWNRTMAVALDKDGFYRGKAEPFASFIKKKCGKTIETVRVSK